MHTLYADENISRSVCEALREAGVDIVHTLMDNIVPPGVDDVTQIEKGKELGRVFVTHDVASFLRLTEEWSKAGRVHAGILLVLNDDPPSVQVRKILSALKTTEGEDPEGALIFARDSLSD